MLPCMYCGRDRAQHTRQDSGRRVACHHAPVILPNAEGLLIDPDSRTYAMLRGDDLSEVQPVSDEFVPTPIYKYKVVCGCGFYTTDSLSDWDSHLAELVAADDGNIKLHTDRVSVVLVQISEEIQ